MAGSPYTGFKRWVKAFEFTRMGLKAAYKHEEAFRQEVFALALAIPLALVLGDSPLEMVLLISSVLLLLIVELLNTAVEVAIDRFGGEIHELSGRAKDIGSAAVFIAVINAVMIWVVLLLN